jgi:ribonuclease BN (tRNA processing enzyme)
MSELTFIGTGEAADPDLPNTSLLYRGARTVLLDCGTSVPPALWQVTRDPDLIDAIFISHRHADHCFGLPALFLWLRETGRRAPLTVIGGVGLEPWLVHLFELAYPGLLAKRGAFDVALAELPPDGALPVGPLTLRTAASLHSTENLAVRIDEGTTSVCYSGDGAPSDATRDMFRGAGTVVHECYGAESVTESHADLATLLLLAEDLDLSRLCLLHFARDQKSAIREGVERYRGAVDVSVPSPGETIDLA